MAQLRRWDNEAIIHEHDGNIRETVEAATKLGISCFRASLDGANLGGANLGGARLDGARLVRASLDGARLDGASLVRASLNGASLDGARLDGASLDGASLDGAILDGARLDGASLDGVSLDRASLDGASLNGASLDGARLPIWCKWTVSYTLQPDLVVHIGCKKHSVAEWDSLLCDIGDSMDTALEHFESSELGSIDDAKRIRANYLAMRAYLVSMGLHSDL
jgi:hypothetical protein